MTYPCWSWGPAPNIQWSSYSYSMRYSNPSERYRYGFSPNRMYFAGSKKSVRFEESERKLQFCSAGNGFNVGRSGSGGGPGGWDPASVTAQLRATARSQLRSTQTSSPRTSAFV